MRDCPDCGYSNSAGYTHCENCGMSLETKVCPACMRTGSIDWANCNYCGTKFPVTPAGKSVPMVKEVKRDDLEFYISALSNEQYSLLYGPPGTGKTSLLVAAAKIRAGSKAETPYEMITLTAEQDRSALIGHMIPTSKGFRWMDGPLTRAFRYGRPLIINEIDKASQDVSDCLHPALDDQSTGLAQLLVVKEDPDDPDNLVMETLRPAKGFRVDATMNGRPSELAPAVLDRFALIAKVPTPSNAQLETLPPYLRDVCTGMYKNINEDHGDMLPAISFRQLRNFSKFITMGIPSTEAALLAIDDLSKAQSLIETLAVNGDLKDIPNATPAS